MRGDEPGTSTGLEGMLPTVEYTQSNRMWCKENIKWSSSWLFNSLSSIKIFCMLSNQTKSFHTKASGSGQEPRNRHFDWNFQVCQNPLKLREPTCVICFFPKSMKKRLDKQAWSSLSTPLPHHPPPPPQLLLSCWKMLNVDTRDMRNPVLKMLNVDTRDMRNPVLHGKKQWWGGGGGGRGVTRENFRPVCQVFSSRF